MGYMRGIERALYCGRGQRGIGNDQEAEGEAEAEASLIFREKTIMDRPGPIQRESDVKHFMPGDQQEKMKL
jgi:hypothetical protein